MLGMMSPRKLTIDLGTFSAWSVADADGLHVVLAGEGDLVALRPLEKLLQDVHDTALETRAPEVTMELGAVDFMNASCLNVVLHWVSKMAALPEQLRYRIRFKPNPRAPWQKRSLETVRSLSTQWITIQA